MANSRSIIIGVSIWMMACSASLAFQQTITQVVRGTVTDQVTKEPLPGANIMITDTEELIGTTTNLDGEFRIEHVPVGRHDIKVSYVGYETVIRTGIMVVSGKQTVLQIEMPQKVFEGEEVTVTPDQQKDQPLNDMAIVSARSFSIEETRRYAGGLDDPARLASAYAGVSAGGGIQNNAIVIRGNAPKSVQYRLEGVPIPNPNHFAGLQVAGGGGLTLFSSQLLSESDFLTGAFPAEYGNVLGGIFDLNFRSGNQQQREHAFQIGVNGIEAASEGPFKKGGSATYLFNYRYSTLALLMPLLPTDALPKYQDVSYKFTFPTEQAGRFEWWGIGGLDKQVQSATRDSTDWEYDFWDRTKFTLDLGIGATGLSHSYILNSSAYIQTTLAATYNTTSLTEDRLNDRLELEPNLRIDDTSGRIIARSFINKRFDRRHVNRTGMSVQHLLYDIGVRSAPSDEPPLVTYVDGSGTSRLVQFFTQSKYEITPSVVLQGGAYSQWFTLTDAWTLEPRASVQWKISNRSALNLGYGLHSQLEELRFYLIRTDAGLPNTDLDPAKAHHGVAGWDYKVNENLRFKTELYYQFLFDVPVVNGTSFSMLNFEQDWSFNNSLVNEGKGKNYGVEVTLERFLNDGFYYLVTGTLYRMEYLGGDGQWRYGRYDQNFVGNALFGKEFMLDGGQNILGINGRLIVNGGRRYDPIDRDASRMEEEVVFNDQQAFARQFPSTFVTDLTVTYRLNHQNYSSIWALQIKNLLAAKDYSYSYNLKEDKVERVEEGYPLPVLSYKIEF